MSYLAGNWPPSLPPSQRSLHGVPNRLTNAVEQKWSQVPGTDPRRPTVGPSQLLEQASVGGPAAYTIDGAVTLSLTPAATMLEGRGIVGAVPLTLTPAAMMLEGRVLAGAVPLTLTPAAQMLEGRVVAGAVPLTLTPAATMVLTPAGGAFTIIGAVTVTLTPAADLVAEIAAVSAPVPIPSSGGGVFAPRRRKRPPVEAPLPVQVAELVPPVEAAPVAVAPTPAPPPRARPSRVVRGAPRPDPVPVVPVEPVLVEAITAVDDWTAKLQRDDEDLVAILTANEEGAYV